MSELGNWRTVDTKTGKPRAMSWIFEASQIHDWIHNIALVAMIVIIVLAIMPPGGIVLMLGAVAVAYLVARSMYCQEKPRSDERTQK